MREPETRTVKLWLLEDSPKARKFRVHPPGDPNNREVWVPRSVTHHLSNHGGTPPACAVEVEEWWLEKNSL